MNAVVTGAAGFLGRRLVRFLREDGLRVTCLVRPSTEVGPLQRAVGPSLWDGVDIRIVDLMDERGCHDALIGTSVVYHLAAGLGGGASTLFLNSVVPTRRLLAAAVAAGVPRFVHVSSLGVYGTQSYRSGDLVDEQSPVDPQPHRRDPYTFSKVVQERIVWESHQNEELPVVVVRPGVIIGPGRGVLSTRVGLSVGPYLIRMGGRQTLPYTYVDNCASAIR
ncbi:MAG: NAD-dependent epimerase/dehydratase family protein, partial [Planctomycetaceae bacterium]|nr:NAD-dependent epimerase/dehydratase family protein [Planctomycetaceae bacterium]